MACLTCKAIDGRSVQECPSYAGGYTQVERLMGGGHTHDHFIWIDHIGDW